jgi:hypothetical protein
MEDVRFDEPVELMTGKPGEKLTVGSAAIAAHCLLREWPAKPGPRHRRARQALVDLFEGRMTPTQAREAFEAAADEAEIRIGGWHARNPVAVFLSKQRGYVGAPVPRRRK